LSQLWLFIIAPLVGAVIAAVVYLATHKPAHPVISVKEAEQALESEQAERQP
jgi:aquaporin Z